MTEHKVIIYSTPSCTFCHKTKDFLKAHKIEFTDIDVQADQEKAKEMIEKSGQMGVPVIDIDGDIIIGFNEEKLRELLEIKE